MGYIPSSGIANAYGLGLKGQRIEMNSNHRGEGPHIRR